MEQSARVSRLVMGVWLSEEGELQTRHMEEVGGKQEPQYMRLVCSQDLRAPMLHLSHIQGLPSSCTISRLLRLSTENI